MAAHFDDLQKASLRIRELIIKQIAHLGVGHLGGSLSVVEVLVSLYYHHLRHDPQRPSLPGRDRFILSKGHAGPALYAVLSDRGYFEQDLLWTLNRIGTRLPSHPDARRTPGVDMTTGSLGQGLSAATGMAIAARLSGDRSMVYALLSDGETHEGQTWEAALYASQARLENLIAFTDYNRMTVDGTTDDINSLDPLADKWRAFGWDVQDVAGNDLNAVDNAIGNARLSRNRPSMIILNTVKGSGVLSIEAAGVKSHNMAFTQDQAGQALAELYSHVTEDPDG